MTRLAALLITLAAIPVFGGCGGNAPFKPDGATDTGAREDRTADVAGDTRLAGDTPAPSPDLEVDRPPDIAAESVSETTADVAGPDTAAGGWPADAVVADAAAPDLEPDLAPVVIGGADGSDPDQPVAEPADAAADQAVDAPVDQAVDESVGQPADAPAGQPVDVSADEPVAGPADVASPPPDTAHVAPDVSPDQPAMADAAEPDMGATSPDGGADLAEGEELFVAGLRGVEEVPPVTTDATGTLTLALDRSTSALRFRLEQTVAGATAAFLHIGSPGEVGSPEIPLLPLSADASGTVSLTASEVTALDEGRLYVNVKSAAFPGGEIRGQVLRPGERAYVADLSGAQQTPPVVSAGSGRLTFILGPVGIDPRCPAPSACVKWRVTTANITPIFGNLHRGPAGLVSHVVLMGFDPLAPLITGTEPFQPDQAADLRRGLCFGDMHSAAFPDGELRGQLIELGETLYTTILSGAAVVPPVTTAGAGGIGLILDAARTSIRYDGLVAGMVPTVAEIHLGPVGSSGGAVYSLSLSGLTISGDQAVTAADLVDLDAGNWYVDVHSSAQPAGEIRGQLGRH
jgi:CHRD domain